MAPTPTTKPMQGHQTPSKTPQSKQRLHFPNPKGGTLPSLNVISTVKETAPTEHPVEVITRIRDYPDRKEKPSSALEISQDGSSVRVRTDIGYRDFSLDGVSVSEGEGLEVFYKRFVESRIEGVRLGAKCTIMMYGPTGAGKSHTMFGCPKEPGIVYRALRHILGDGAGGNGADDIGFRLGLFVQVAVLEIYNEEIYDLLSGNVNGGASIGLGLPKGTPKVRLEVMGKKAKNATYISGNEAGKISREVAKVEKRRIVKSTLCNERSSRSHCLIILDVPSVGGRLMLVDMAGSENIEQAGQSGFEAKMQTAKINQGNIALKRVVESIANGDSHVPFRDSKLTMLLQDSFEDDKSKILMVLCASPDPKEMHKTISTLEYGAKAKCIVRVAHMPTPKDKMNSDESSTLLRSRIVAMNQFIYKLQMDNKMKEKERDDSLKELHHKEEEVVELRSKLKLIEGRGLAAKEEEINLKVDERTQALRLELMKMEEKILLQQQELLMLRRMLEEMESERAKAGEDAFQDIDGGRFMKRLSEIYAGDQGMEKSMELDMGGDQLTIHDVKEIKEEHHHRHENSGNCSPVLNDDEGGAITPRFPDKVCLSTVFEGDDEGEDRESTEEDEVDKEVVEESTVGSLLCTANPHSRDVDNSEHGRDAMGKLVTENAKDTASARRTRIQNIFSLCGIHRELAQQVRTPTPSKKPEAENIQSSPLARGEEESGAKENIKASPLPPCLELLGAHNNVVISDLSGSDETSQESKENRRPADGLMDVYVKWEASKEFSGNLFKKLRVMKHSTLSDLRKQIDAHLEEDNNKQPFTFLLLGDPSGAPVAKEKEAAVHASRLPICNNLLNGRLACLRPIKKAVQQPDHIPFSSLENTLHSCTKFAAPSSCKQAAHLQ